VENCLWELSLLICERTHSPWDHSFCAASWGCDCAIRRDTRAIKLMSAIRRVVKSCIVFLLGSESRPRTILRGLASGYRICVSPAGQLGYLLGTDEPHLQRAIRDYVARGDTVYDIGANIGYVSLSLAKRVGSSGRVIAFEPVPRNIDAFRENIGINGITTIQLLEFAASDRAGEAVIRIADNPSTASLVWHRDNSSATELGIRTVSIDELVEAGELGYPKFVKIDVEGAEGSVLQGMHRTIAAARPVLFVECSEAGREKAWPLLQELGYRCQSAITRKWVDTFDEYRHSDFLWLPAHP
jgi:FkbM family methyltransferase